MIEINRLLDRIDPSALSYEEWIQIGMALKNAGQECAVWDEWSSRDAGRYHCGECESKWSTFSEQGVQLGTAVAIARQHGIDVSDLTDGVLNWDSVIYDHTSRQVIPERTWGDPMPVAECVGQVKRYLQLLFRPDEHVCIVTKSMRTESGKWRPAESGRCDRTSGEVITDLDHHPQNLAEVIGEWTDGGAWVCINPVDGKGRKGENISSFRYVLVESDTLELQKQVDLFHRFRLPIACIVYSGGKSMHAVVRVDAPTLKEYEERVDYLYSFLAAHGVEIDTADRNPGRLTRLPGVTRNGKQQELVEGASGCASWEDWLALSRKWDAQQPSPAQSVLPKICTLKEILSAPYKRPDELISGILHRGAKMMLSGPSKAGKSFLLMELAVSLSEGTPWLGRQCKKSRVLYVNLEIDGIAFGNRFRDIYGAMGIKAQHSEDLMIWTLRGFIGTIRELAPTIIATVRDMQLDAIIFDPIYKALTGDENSATDMAEFTRYMDSISSGLDCAVIYCHHHSKGQQGDKSAQDRASGSGVFARDADAILDLIQLQVQGGEDTRTAWRIESCLRDFANCAPINVWFDYPLHHVDDTGELKFARVKGKIDSMRDFNAKATTPQEREESIDDAYAKLSKNGDVTVDKLAEELGVCPKTIRNRISEAGTFTVKNSVVTPTHPSL